MGGKETGLPYRIPMNKYRWNKETDSYHQANRTVILA